MVDHHGIITAADEPIERAGSSHTVSCKPEFGSHDPANHR
jgi:hypothetical protein